MTVFVNGDYDVRLGIHQEISIGNTDGYHSFGHISRYHFTPLRTLHSYASMPERIFPFSTIKSVLTLFLNSV